MGERDTATCKHCSSLAVIDDQCRSCLKYTYETPPSPSVLEPGKWYETHKGGKCCYIGPYPGDVMRSVVYDDGGQLVHILTTNLRSPKRTFEVRIYENGQTSYAVIGRDPTPGNWDLIAGPIRVTEGEGMEVSDL